ncbi:Proliferating cell nuclear antigen [Termitomyces sp. J132]|nr:Proliferating cell nuclear antigen [Termitomyces sp. J132]
MMEAKLSKTRILKKLLDVIEELINDTNFECNEEGITLQAMDNLQVMLVSVLLEAMGFEHYSIPHMDYDAHVTMPSSKFMHIVHDFSLLENAEDAKVINVNADKEEEEQVTDGKKIKKEKKVKKEAMDEQVEMDGDEFKANSNGEGEEEKEEDEDEGKEGRKKHKKSSDKPSKKAKTALSLECKSKKEEEDKKEQGICIEMNLHILLTFSLRYLINFLKSASLSSCVHFMMSNEVPLLIKLPQLLYDFGQGYIWYYLMLKIGND